MPSNAIPRPAIAVVIPAYNGAKTLTACLECLAAQACSDFRVIIVESCSTDRTPEIVAELSARDARFSVVTNENHLVPLENFRKAVDISAAAADFVCSQACDKYFERLHEALLANSDKFVAACDVERITLSKVQQTDPNPNIFGFPENYANGRVPRNLTFSTEWFYGLFGSSAKDRFVGRWHEKPNPWAFASYVMAEFIMLDLFVYVLRPTFKFTLSDRLRQLVGAKTLKDKIRERLNFTFGTFAFCSSDCPRALWWPK